jgi:microcystin-dependent protein
MSAPVTPSEFKSCISDPSGSLCSNFLKALLKLPVLVYKLVNWMLDSAGNPTNDFISSFVPPGALLWTAATQGVTGYLICDGSEIDRTQYANLFDAIGTVYGPGNGTSTFRIPDFRDKFPIGAGGARAIGATGGEETHKLSVSELPAHDHPVGENYSTIIVTDPSINNGALAGSTGDAEGKTDAIGKTGGDEAHNNMPPFLACYVYIKI